MADLDSISQKALWEIPILKKCCRCKQKKTLSEFYPARNKLRRPGSVSSRRKALGIRSECIACALECGRIRSRRPEEQEKKRRSRVKVRGLKLEEHNAIFKAQGGVCAICRKPETARAKSGTLRSLAIDHDHATDKPRGLLCHNCNVGLGVFGDDPVRIRDAADYLDRHRSGS